MPEPGGSLVALLLGMAPGGGPAKLNPLMDRRLALKRLALLAGGTLSASTVAGVLGGCRSDTPAGAAFTPQTLSEAQTELVATIAEHIIPTTDTPGAREAGVHEFIDRMLTEWYPADERDRFLEGLDALDAETRRVHGASFLELSSEQQVDVLTALDAAAYPSDPAETAAVRAQIEADRPPFFRTMKELTVVGYYTSEIGASRELRVNPMGTFRGDVPYDEIGRAWGA